MQQRMRQGGYFCLDVPSRNCVDGALALLQWVVSDLFLIITLMENSSTANNQSVMKIA